jgi:hypothetical protein
MLAALALAAVIVPKGLRRGGDGLTPLPPALVPVLTMTWMVAWIRLGLGVTGAATGSFRRWPEEVLEHNVHYVLRGLIDVALPID